MIEAQLETRIMIYGPPYSGKSASLGALYKCISDRLLIKIPIIDFESFYGFKDHFGWYVNILRETLPYKRIIISCADYQPTGKENCTVYGLFPDDYPSKVFDKIQLGRSRFGIEPRDDYHTLKGAIKVYNDMLEYASKHEFTITRNPAEFINMVKKDFHSCWAKSV